MNEVSVYENFVFAAVKGDYGEKILPFYQYAVLMDVSKDIRLNLQFEAVIRQKEANENGFCKRTIKKTD